MALITLITLKALMMRRSLCLIVIPVLYQPMSISQTVNANRS
jgi:hypothetical protein